MPTLVALNRRYACSMLSASADVCTERDGHAVVDELHHERAAGRRVRDEVGRLGDRLRAAGQPSEDRRLVACLGVQSASRPIRTRTGRARRRRRRACDEPLHGSASLRSTPASRQVDAGGYRSAPCPTADDRLRKYAAARRQGRPEPAARPDAGGQRARRARAVRARDRARGVRGGRIVRRRPVRRPARAPRAHCARGRRPARLLAAVGGRALRRARPHRRRAARHLGQSRSPSSSPTSTASVSARRG